MGILTPDTSQAQDFSEPIAPGTYRARIKAAEAGTSKQGKPKVVVKLDVDVEGKSRSRQAHLPVTGEGAGAFDKLLRATGFAGLADDFKRGAGTAFDTDQLIGQECQVVISEDIYEGQKRDQIQTFLPL